MTPEERRAFIRLHTRLLPVAHAPEVLLHVADSATDLWEKTEAELAEFGLPPPYWAFAWAGGQALARHVLDHPALVCGRSVLDLGAGSGLAGIASSKAGAAEVTLNDVDAFALAAMELNLQANGTSGLLLADDLLARTPPQVDVILAGDLCYEREMAARVIAWLASAHRAGAEVLLGDPGRSYLPRQMLEPVAEYRVPTLRALEDNEVKRTFVWRLVSAA